MNKFLYSECDTKYEILTLCAYPRVKMDDGRVTDRKGVTIQCTGSKFTVRFLTQSDRFQTASAGMQPRRSVIKHSE